MKRKFINKSPDTIAHKSKIKNVIILSVTSLIVLSVSFIAVRAFSYSPGQNNELKPQSIMIYSIQQELNATPTPTVLPDYELGNVTTYRPISYEEWKAAGGHQPWRMDPFLFVRAVTANLVPENISSQKNMTDAKGNWTESGNTATNKDGVIIKLVDPSDDSLRNPSGAKSLTYNLFVPHLGAYEITVQQPSGSVFFIVEKIIFNPD